MKKYKAGALYYAIFISFFIALVSGFMLLQHWYQHYYNLYVAQGERLDRNIKSALLVALQNPEKFREGDSTKFDIYEDSVDWVNVSKRVWGGYQILQIESKWRVLHRSQIKLVGTEFLPEDVIALYLSDEGKYLSLAGKTEITGNCFLPKLGVRKAYIEGTGFSGNKLIDGEIKNSKESLPSVDPKLIEHNRLSDQAKIAETDSLVEIENLLRSDSLKNSFCNKTVKINSPLWITLENKVISGNVKIISATGISVKRSAVLSDIILYAPKIEIEEGFSGSLQCFATDTLITGDDCIFKYPTLLVINETKIEKPIVMIGENSVVLGDIVVLAKSDKQNISAECSIDSHTIINGSVYCAGKVNLKGTIKGQLFCKGFILRTNSSVYENHLLYAKLNSSLLSPHYAGSMYIPSAKPLKMIKCLQ
ncbi:MAG TPA: hypothetical protein VHO90_13830 [Bacteroidales bacterium]|nr:hypothetical protein [Bacteroidales bacterium]